MTAIMYRKPIEMRACSACAGDYEDPDRTAWPIEESGEDKDGRRQETGAEEFPAEEQERGRRRGCGKPGEV